MSYYDIKISGKDVKRFIRNLYRLNICLYNINYINRSVVIRVNKKDLDKILSIKTIYDINIIKYYGIAMIKNFFRKYKLFFTLLSIFFILFIINTNIIYSIDINTDNKTLKEKLLISLNNYGLKKGKFCLTYTKKESIKKKILSKYKDNLEWIEIKRIGTKYVISLEERKKNINKSDLEPSNIVASKNGIITKIDALSGEISVKVGDYVKKGDILISGSIHKNDTVVSTVKSLGNIYAEVWYTVSVELPYYYHEKSQTGNSSIGLSISFLSKKRAYFKKYRSYDTKNIFSIKSLFLPVSISLEKRLETKEISSINSLDYAYFSSFEIARTKLLKTLGKDSQIIFEKKLKTTEINSKIYVVIFYKVIENIARSEAIRN